MFLCDIGRGGGVKEEGAKGSVWSEAEKQRYEVGFCWVLEPAGAERWFAFSFRAATSVT